MLPFLFFTLQEDSYVLASVSNYSFHLVDLRCSDINCQYLLKYWKVNPEKTKINSSIDKRANLFCRNIELKHTTKSLEYLFETFFFCFLVYPLYSFNHLFILQATAKKFSTAILSSKFFLKKFRNLNQLTKPSTWTAISIPPTILPKIPNLSTANYR